MPSISHGFLRRAFVLACLAAGPAAAQGYGAWSKSGAIAIGTTPVWADYAGGAVAGFPVLVRLDSSVFNFSEAKAGGADIRFSTGDGATALPYEIEIWDAARGQASIWVRVPSVAGNAVQTLRMYWGNAAANSESNGAAVFRTQDGFIGVWHLSDPAGGTQNRDATANGHHGTKIRDSDKAPSAAVIGTGESPLGTGQAYNRGGVFGYTEIPDSAVDLRNKSLTISAWIKRDSLKGGDYFVAQGTQDPGVGIRMGFNHYNYFHFGFGGGVEDPQYPFTSGFTDTAGWHLWTGTFNAANREMSIYRDGEFVIKTTANGAFQGMDKLHFGWAYGPSGEYYHPVGILDEVRISGAARPADWIRLSYLNQKRNQKMVGFPVPTGCAENFAVNSASVSVAEGSPVVLAGTAKCAQLFEWVRVANGAEEPVDFRGTRLELVTRVRGTRTETYRFKGLYAGAWRSRDVQVTITESIPEPELALELPPWFDISDPGVPMLAVAKVANKAQIAASAAPVIRYQWTVTRFGELNFTNPRSDDTLEIYSLGVEGDFLITVCADNGGPPECRSRIMTASTTGIRPGSARAAQEAFRLHGTALTWSADARIRVFALDGRLAFDRRGRKGSRLVLDPGQAGLFRSPGYRVHVERSPGGGHR